MFNCAFSRHVANTGVCDGVRILKFEQAATVFDPELIDVMASALDDAWNRIEKSGSRFARPGYARVMREVLARRIIETVREDVKDPIELADDAVQFFCANYTDGRVAALTETI
jgi:hypothetical protein